MNLFGREVVHVVERTETQAVVQLDDGRLATVPASSELYAETELLATGTRKPDVPSTVTNAQARIALRNAGLLETIQSIVDQSPPSVIDAWEYSPTISRDSSLVLMISQGLGMTDENLDTLFAAASSIVL